MANLFDANAQWSSRPDDERFVSLLDLQAHVRAQRLASKAVVVSSRKLSAQPLPDHRGLVVVGPNGHPVAPSHWAFGQLSSLAGAPASYLRKLPAELAADNLNFGLLNREVEDVGVLLRKGSDGATLAAATGPAYGRIWNVDVVDALVHRFGDGLSGDFRVPGEFGHRVDVTKANTTLYASDRDMWVFLADEEHRIELPNRRNGETGSFARGFIVGNSEVGSATLFVKTFLFDYVCANRIIWGAEDVQEIRIRHTAKAPDRFIEQVTPALVSYANSSARGVVKALEAARSHRLFTPGAADEKRDEAVEKFLAGRFSRPQARAMMAAHQAEEERPVETLWDAVTAATAYAKGITYQDERVAIEEKAGDMLREAA